MEESPQSTLVGSRPLVWRVADAGSQVILTPVSAGSFQGRVSKAERWLEEREITFGVPFLVGFGENHTDELVLRRAALNLGAVPITVNWQADTLDMLMLKAQIASSSKLVVHTSFRSIDLDAIAQERPELQIHRLDGFDGDREPREQSFVPRAEVGDPNLDQVVIFTSGTTGQPKGVRLSRRAYEVNAAIFEKLLDLEAAEPVRLVLVNPLYHANSTAMADFALRRPNTDIVLIPRYSGEYWACLEAACQGFEGKVIAPAVSRHFEFLDNLLQSSKLEMTSELDRALRRTRFLVGSAPVGPETLARFVRLTGRPPQVRFGSTELCLQALGIPPHLDAECVKETFARGVEASERPGGQAGYYIGRPHPPHTDARVVRGVTHGADDFLEPAGEGELGFLVVRSDCVMTGYTGNPGATEAAIQDEWYLGLGDMAFWLGSRDGGARDYFWVSRTAGLMIRGGSNYSCQQVEAELTEFVSNSFALDAQDFELAVVGEKLVSEHEDACCVLIALLSERATALRPELERDFVDRARQAVSKGARPDRLAFGPIARNFKGAIIRAEVRKSFCD